MPRTVAVAASRSAFAVSTAALFTATGGLIRLLVQFDEKITPAHPVVVIDENARDLAANPGGNEGDMTVHECVVGRNGVESIQNPRNANHEDGC